MKIQEKILKNLDIKFSGRSSDYMIPTILQGCFGNCSYCYAARHNPNSFYNEIKVSTNIDKIIEKVNNYDTSSIVKPNQTHDKYITWDLACNSDLTPALHLFDWQKVFDYFKYSKRDFGTFATKFVNNKLLTYNPERKIRVRLTLVPEIVHNNVEKNTADIIKRINFISKLYDAGYEVHINFSPVIYYNGWLDDYKKLFKFINTNVSDDVKKQLQCEVIFLTHNESLHNWNLENKVVGEKVLWVPELQENKISKFGGNNIRYKHQFKAELIKQFKQLLQSELPYCNIRYIF
jgi:DNA repair photolyase